MPNVTDTRRCPRGFTAIQAWLDLAADPMTVGQLVDVTL